MQLRISLVLAVALASGFSPAAGQDTYTGVERIVAVGDVHGDFAQFVTILRQAGVIDEKNRWIGGKTHLVQNGDILDRGDESRKVMDLLMALEPAAERAGGKVHALIGNHEAMNILGDLRYVSAGEYEAFRSSRARTLRDRAFAALADSARHDDPEYRTRWDADHPLGWVEHRLAFEGNGRYGTWIRGRNAVLRIDNYLFVHGGISSKYVSQPAAELNALVHQDLAPGGPRNGIAEDSLGPLWYRGLATGNEDSLATQVDQVLANFGVQHVVIGHTVTPGAVMARFGGKVIMIDVGLSAAYEGPPAALVIENGTPLALHRGRRLALPLGGDQLAYFKAAAALEPPQSRLKAYVEKLEAAAAGAWR